MQSGILVPVGIINAAVGGSNIESWLNQKPFETGGNYAKHIEPLVGFGLRGVIWYQGESNEKDKRTAPASLTSSTTGDTFNPSLGAILRCIATRPNP